MVLKIYDSLSKQKKRFFPRDKKIVKMFVCGPTVYEHAHIGHARSYIFFDVVARYLRMKGYNLFYLQNITDLGRKIKDAAEKAKKPPSVLAKELTKSYLNDMKKLNVSSVNKYEASSKNIKKVIDQIRRLLKMGLAYSTKDGIYFDTSKCNNFGGLYHKKISETNQNSIEKNNLKKSPSDFALWNKDKKWGRLWPVSFGKGRPNWHILDTALIEKYFKNSYDIHGGGVDLIYPHHESIRITLLAFSKKTFPAKYWIHNELLEVNKKKMSKSFNNFVYIKDILKKYDAETLRLFMLSTHYKKKINYSERKLIEAEKRVKRIKKLIIKLSKVRTKKGINVDNLTLRIKTKFRLAMDDDFNIELALKEIYKFIKKVEILIDKENLSSRDSVKIYEQLLNFDKVLGLNLNKIHI